MTSLSRKKLQITAPNSQRCLTISQVAAPSSGLHRTYRLTWIEALRDSCISKALAGGLLVVLSAHSVNAQQSNGWSPQPYARPSASSAPETPPAVPANSLRPSESTNNGDVVRWGKVTVQNKTNSDSTAHAEPRTGFGRSIAKQPERNNPPANFPANHSSNGRGTRASQIQLASHNESVNSAPAAADRTEKAERFEKAERVEKSENRTNGVWQAKDSVKAGISLGPANEKSQRSDVQKAKYQDPLPILPGGLLPEASSSPKDLSIGPPPINRNPLLDNMPNANPAPPTRSNRSLLEQDPVKPNPFSEPKSSQNSDTDRSPSDDIEPPALGLDRDRDPAPAPPIRRDSKGVDCDAVRQMARDFDITKIAIDSSPSFVKGIPDRRKPGANTKEAFVASAESRSWVNVDGQVVAEGKLIDLVRDSVVIERADGSRTTYLLHELCDADKAYVSEKWGLPITCSIDDRSFPRRDFMDTTVTWKASGACHKPLYFEDVQLERYGHEWGPFAQPVMSTAHFFGDVLVLPYKMGIHPMNECQYSLGHYRPGNCAPWTVGPVPISLRGALMEAKVITGAALILP